MKRQTLHIVIWKEDNLYVAKFLELELASQGTSRKEALKNLQEALELYLEDKPKEHLSFPSIQRVTSREILLN